MVVNETLMQFQADQLGVDVILPQVTETTALEAAFAAGLAVGLWTGEHEITSQSGESKRWSPAMPPSESEHLLRNWKKAVTKAMGWVDEEPASQGSGSGPTRTGEPPLG